MKAILRDLNHFEPLQLRTLLTPSMNTSLANIVKTVFRQSSREGLNEELGFNVLRYLNEVDTKYYKVLYPEQTPLQDPGTETGAITAPIVAPSSTILAPIKNHPMLQQLSQMADRFWALPIPVVTATALAPVENRTTALVPTAATLDPLSSSPLPPSAVLTAANMHPLSPGVLLATHPLSDWPFAKCVMLVVETRPEYVNALILNYPRVYPVGDRNFVFPTTLRRQPCRVGGPVLSYDTPPVPNYHILHHYPAIPNSKVLIPDDARPVCVSTGEDIEAIGKFMKKGNIHPDQFCIFTGSFVIAKFELQKQVQDGLWMPIAASPEFVQQASQMGRYLWDGLMAACGGEFAHLPRVSNLVEAETNAPATS
jgi:hypothetical protein